ncbi:hypothetical protein OGATHE_005220 [Ogataea polymorpha]|uniref:Uncharacterized protein n=1 Tax=Ogataea polymorpha TaxID=460523 RepID=A0A9P8SZM7_9ASCO|nr:hypothetical protein OGATHE_005220 [Ogataea polymorpha]
MRHHGQNSAVWGSDTKLTTVTGTESKSVCSFLEKLVELGSGTIVVEDRCSPTVTSSQDITVRESSTGSNTNKAVQGNFSGNDIGHVNVNGVKAGLLETPGHLLLAVDTLFSQNCHFRAVGQG